MKGLLSLPTELLLHIFETVSLIEEDRTPFTSLEKSWDYLTTYRTLAALACTSRALQPIATELLFKRAVWPFDYPIAAFTSPIEPSSIQRRDTKHIETFCSSWHRHMLAGDKSQGRPRQEIEADAARFLGWREGVQTVFKYEPCGIELALLVARSPNLETFTMDGWGLNYTCSSPWASEPFFWLLPIVQAAQQILRGITEGVPYQHLHAVDFHMQRCCKTSVAYLFALPRLRKLRLNEMNNNGTFDNHIPWPVPTRSSAVEELVLDQVDLPGRLTSLMIISCRALSHFTFNHSIHDGRLRPEYLVEIMSALEKQHDSLRILNLEPNDFEPNNMGLEHLTYTRLDGFHKLHALEKLSVPFRTLMGRPPRTSTTEEELYYPQMRHVLPPQLEELDLYIKPSETCPAYSDRYPSIFTSVLPSDSEHLHLKKVHLTYRKREPCEFAMLMNIWDMKQTFLEHGVHFEYSITFATSHSNCEPGSDELDYVSQGLARFGPKGVEMAHHFGKWRDEMVARVLIHLDYTADWMDSEEGRVYMFGAVSEPLKCDARYGLKLDL